MLSMGNSTIRECVELAHELRPGVRFHSILRRMHIVDEWGEDFLKLMLGEDHFALTRSRDENENGPPITTSPHAGDTVSSAAMQFETPSARDDLPNTSSYAIALDAVETALLLAGPKALNGPYTILAFVAAIIIQQHVPDKSKTLKQIFGQDPRFSFVGSEGSSSR